MGKFSDAITAIATRLDAMDKEIKEVKEAKADEVAMELLAHKTPRSSIEAMIANRAIGSPEAMVRKNSSLAKSEPKIPDDQTKEQPTGIPFLDRLITTTAKAD
jgi:hypothetical protein